ncbi:ion transporter [Limnoglobus roseus]|uniref:Ion transport domain-containing protein n=1 Tax=Limnoglobus roseus TaxID=2598579 RepID=A0A5C1AAM8_9BACT|nr:ion transporter [Limnoglobus roseus]QEL16271.1 hypothetical protein PX52LOC_03212 [Limnoglobus roseus]
MNAWSRRVASSPPFHKLAMTLIVLNAVVLGLEAIPSLSDSWRPTFIVLNRVFQGLFTAEILIRFLAAKSPAAFFRDGWNSFDVIVVAVAFVPAAGPTATVARLTRVLRIVRLIEVSQEMKLIVGTIIASLRSLSRLIVMIVLLLYSYAIVGFHLFHESDPANWGDLGKGMWTLFQTMTLEGWVEKQKVTFDAQPHETWIFYSTFLLFTTYFVLNLFVAIVVNNLQTMKEEQQESADAAHPQADLLAQIDGLRAQLDSFEAKVRATKG